MVYEFLDVCQEIENPGFETEKKVYTLDYKAHWNSVNRTDYYYVTEHPNDDYVINVSKQQLGKDYNNPNNYFVHKRYGTRGGVIVTSKEDIGLCCGSATTDLKPDWMSKLCSGLNARGIPAVLVGNDVLINGCKIAGYARGISQTGFTCYSAVIEMDTKIDVIREVCLKPMGKVPVGLSAWGVTREEVLEMLDIERK